MSLLTAVVVSLSGCSMLTLPRLAPAPPSTGSTHPGTARAAGSQAGVAPPSGTPQPPPSPPPPPPAHACYRLRFGQLAQSATTTPPTPCRREHDAQTIFIGHLGAKVDGVDSSSARDRMARVCPRQMAHFLGGTPAVRHLSRFNVVWFVPTPDQAAAGARWFRCDVVAFARSTHLMPLLRPRRLRGVLDDSSALDTYGLCGSTAPGSSGFERVVCGRHHRWRAVSTIHLSGQKYPGRHAVRVAGDSTCRDRVRAAAGYSLRFRYGWEWPTREQWRNGQHYGFCWAPD